MPKCLVTGAGGFIGYNLVKRLVKEGHFVRAADLYFPKGSAAHDTLKADLRDKKACEMACEKMDVVYHMAADVGGVGYVVDNPSTVFRHNIILDTNMIESARSKAVRMYVYASGSSIYPKGLQEDKERLLVESDAYPAQCANSNGWEKLFGEQLCQSYQEDYHMEIRIARFCNIYGPYCILESDKERSVAAICRKVLESRESVHVWGDGSQERSYCYIDDCLDAILALVKSNLKLPVNIGGESVSVGELADLVLKIANRPQMKKLYEMSKPMGSRFRKCDCSLIQKHCNWTPKTSLENGVTTTYQWIEQQINKGLNWHG